MGCLECRFRYKEMIDTFAIRFVVIGSSALIALLTHCAPGVAVDTLQAVVMAESRGNPFRINVNQGARLTRQPRSKAEATEAARALLAMGASFDAGLTQVNSANFRRFGLTAENVFEPCTNLAAGAAILRENYRTAVQAGHAAPLTAALSLYNTGSMSRGISNGYVQRVHRAAGVELDPVATDRGATEITPELVSRLLLSAFGGRITDTWRSWNATYGAIGSYHKSGQAVDLVPAGGVHAIAKADIEAVMSAQGIRLLELLGPGDRGHDDHWHVAFARERVKPASLDPLVTADRSPPARSGTQSSSPPPAWDVFASNVWIEGRNMNAEN